jgi:hypothetical protein
VLAGRDLLDRPPDGIWAAFVSVFGINVAHIERRARHARFAPGAAVASKRQWPWSSHRRWTRT